MILQKMDVTSLLNSSSVGTRNETACPDQIPTSSTIEDTPSPPRAPTPTSEEASPERPSEHKTPSRNRTPWDAGGYSLPSLETKTAHVPGRAAESNSPMSPTSPKHKSSNSSSSFSSYAPSLSSLSHSRFSSRSTISGCQAVTGVVPEAVPIDSTSKPKDQLLLADLSKISKYDGNVLPISRRGRSSVSGLGRPRSPSDAMLILRARQNSDRASLYETTM